MADFFSVLGLPRRPWLESDAVKQAFHRQSAALHPDVPGTGDAQKFTELNAAYSALRDPASRLRHLLELLAPAQLGSNAQPPLELADMFMRFGGLRRRIDALFAKRAAATSPLAKALLASEDAGVHRELLACHTDLESAIASAEMELRALDASWSDAGIVEAARLYQRFAYLSRWLAQAREAALRWE